MKALVTGASSGMGRDMAKYLLELNYDLILVSRNKEKLDKEFESYKDKVKTYSFDLTKEEECIKLYEEVKNENIDILINNAGFGDSGNFTETNLDKELEMIDLNVKAYHILTKLFLKDFVKRNYGRILNVASIAGFMPGPYMATYYATKNYIVSLSLAIYEELKKDNSKVKISVFCPGPVTTNFNEVANVKFSIAPLSSEYASKVAIEGMFENKLLIIPNNMKVNHLLTKIVPTKIVLGVTSLVQERRSTLVEQSKQNKTNNQNNKDSSIQQFPIIF